MRLRGAKVKKKKDYKGNTLYVIPINSLRLKERIKRMVLSHIMFIRRRRKK